MAIAPVTNNTVNATTATTATDSAAQIKSIIDNAVSTLTNMSTISHADGSSWNVNQRFGQSVADGWKAPYLSAIKDLGNQNLTPDQVQAQSDKLIQGFEGRAEFMKAMRFIIFTTMVQNMQEMSGETLNDWQESAT
jgi:ribulose bisphosphate carboxylase small subunit